MLSLKDSLAVLRKTEALKEGHFVLSSGLHSPQYVQCAKLLSFPNKAAKICKSLASKIKKKFNIFFFDPPYADNSYTENIEKIKKLSLYEKNHLIIVHREKKTNDGLEKILKIMLIKNYGRSNVIFGVLN